jgi:chromate reductase, NAD(P)H dehydrogenase (quinone)
MTQVRILGISGSLRSGSYNRALLRAAGELAPSNGIELTELDLSPIPFYDGDVEAGGDPKAVADLRHAVHEADALLLATPEYNRGTSGVLKNALDWLSRPLVTNPLWGKPVAVVGASTGLFGAVWAQAELRKVLGALSARVIDRELPVGQADAAFTEDGCLAASELERMYEETLGELLACVPESAAA